jgi:hypothetical protein
MSNRRDKERGPWCETDRVRSPLPSLSVCLSFGEWSRRAIFARCVSELPLVLCMCCASRGPDGQQQQHQAHGAAADGATLKKRRAAGATLEAATGRRITAQRPLGR